MSDGIRKAKFGELVFDVLTEEDISDAAEVTSKPVESGINVSDHFKRKPTVISVSGAFTTKDAPEQLQQLLKVYKAGNIHKYVGRNAYANMVITNMNRQHEANNRDGFDFSMQLQQVHIAKSQEFDVKSKPPKVNKNKKTKKQSKKKTKTQVKKKTTRGRKQPVPKKTTTNKKRAVVTKKQAYKRGLPKSK